MRRWVIGIATTMLVVLGLGLVAGAGGAEPDANKVAYWCEQGIKIEPVDTPFVVPEPPEGYTWTLLVIKGGTTNQTFENPVVGDSYSHSAHDNSHVILCKEADPETSTTVTTEASSTTEGTVVTRGSTTTAPDTTTTVGSSTTTTQVTTTASTLPDTGLGDGPGLLIAAVAAVSLGALAVRSARDRKEGA